MHHLCVLLSMQVSMVMVNSHIAIASIHNLSLNTSEDIPIAPALVVL